MMASGMSHSASPSCQLQRYGPRAGAAGTSATAGWGISNPILQQQPAFKRTVPFQRATTFQCAASGKGFGGLVSSVKKGFGPKKGGAGKGKQQDDEILPVWEADKKQCPCASGKHYEECCERYHQGAETEPTAEALMRARFSAYVKGQVDYIVATTHPDNPAAGGSKTPDGNYSSSLKEDVQATCSKIGFRKLKIIDRQAGSHADEEFVEFQAWFKVVGQRGQRQKGTKLESLREKSRFLKGEDGRWKYVEGVTDWGAHVY